MTIYTREELEGMTRKQLIEIFNAIPGTKAITSFGSRDGGINRILSVQPTP